MSLNLTDTYLDSPFERKRYKQIIPKELLKELAQKQRVDANQLVGFCATCPKGKEKSRKSMKRSKHWLLLVLFVILVVLVANCLTSDTFHLEVSKYMNSS